MTLPISRIPTLLLVLVTAFTFLRSDALALRVIIDAGHGGHDSGAREGMTMEKHLAFDTAMRLRRYLKKRGYSVTMTRSRDHFITLSDRLRMGSRPGNNIFISIHYNSARNRSATGLETFFYTSRSRDLAGHVQYQMVKKVGARDRGIKYRGFKVVRNSRNPAILVEGGFLSNRSERRRCLSPSYRQKIAEAIGFGIQRYQKSR